MSRVVQCSLALLACIGATGASAHDFGSLTQPSNTTTDGPAAAGGINLQALDPPTRSVIVNTSKWPIGRAVKVCFYEGSPELRRSISEAAMKWFDGGGINLSLDFGAPPSLRTCSPTADSRGFFEDIRIGYRASGQWSYIGVD